MKIDVKHIAKLANLPLTKEEEEKFATQLQQTIEYVDSLEKINTEGIEPTSQVTGLENVTRQDKAAPSLPQEAALSNTKSQHNGFFKVKAILDNE